MKTKYTPPPVLRLPACNLYTLAQFRNILHSKWMHVRPTMIEKGIPKPTNQQLAKDVGVSIQTLYFWLYHHKAPKLENLEKLRELTGHFVFFDGYEVRVCVPMHPYEIEKHFPQEKKDESD